MRVWPASQLRLAVHVGLFGCSDFPERFIRDLATGELPKRTEAHLPQVVKPVSCERATFLKFVEDVAQTAGGDSATGEVTYEVVVGKIDLIPALLGR
jgi:hypothetical protein